MQSDWLAQRPCTVLVKVNRSFLMPVHSDRGEAVHIRNSVVICTRPPGDVFRKCTAVDAMSLGAN